MKKILIYILIFISAILGMLILTINYLPSVLHFIVNDQHVQFVLNLAAISSGLAGFALAISSINETHLTAMREYFNEGDNPEYALVRGRLYDLKEDDDIVELINQEKSDGKEYDDYSVNKATSMTINFFHKWGLMEKKGYLPLDVFKGSSGRQVIRLYSILEPYILSKRKDNEDYAENFTYLKDRVKKKYKY